jgi:hypothetical protein
VGEKWTTLPLLDGMTVDTDGKSWRSERLERFVHVGPATPTGKARKVVVPSPIWPSALSPQQ